MNNIYTRKVVYINKNDFDGNAQRQVLSRDLWTTGGDRWRYHHAAVELARTVPLSVPAQVLEAGSLGAQIIHDSDTVDCENHLWKPVDAPTLEHDLRNTPWPVEDGRYMLFIALRVWQHLWPKQRESLMEAFRVAEYVLIGVPETYYQERGIPRETILDWTKGHTLLEEHHIHSGAACNLYLWRR